MAIGLLGALLPDMSCSVRMCGECRGWGADTEPPVGPIFAGGEGGTSPATAWTVYGQRERERGRSNDINECTTVLCVYYMTVGQTRQKHKDKSYIHEVDLMRDRWV